jgi:chromate transporter
LLVRQVISSHPLYFKVLVLFILPAFAMVLALSVVYQRTSLVTQLGPALLGLQCGALAAIFLSIWALFRPFRSDHRAWAIILVATPMVALKPGWEPWVILAFGLWGASRSRSPNRVHSFFAFPFVPALSSLGVSLGSLGKANALTLFRLFKMCFKAGVFVFGTGLAVVPVLEADSVNHFHWLTHSQFMDGLAIGQVTPGPVVITSTFIGYLAGGLAGAMAATIGMFFPSCSVEW